MKNYITITNMIMAFACKVNKSLLKVCKVKRPIVTQIRKRDYHSLQFNFNEHFYTLRFEKPGCISIIWTVGDLVDRAYVLKGNDAKEYFDFGKFRNILMMLEKEHNASKGINWELIDKYLEKYGRRN